VKITKEPESPLCGIRSLRRRRAEELCMLCQLLLTLLPLTLVADGTRPIVFILLRIDIHSFRGQSDRRHLLNSNSSRYGEREIVIRSEKHTSEKLDKGSPDSLVSLCEDKHRLVKRSRTTL